MDTVTYPDPDVAAYLAELFIPLRLMLDNREHWPVFRANHIIWTPTAGFMDRNGSLHYHSVAFLPPGDFLSVMRIGRARCLMAWTRSAEAAEELDAAAGTGNSIAPEALYWLGVARFLVRRDSATMWEAWDRLVSLYPDTPWAKRVYPRPNQVLLQ
ncbi:MAG TPA: thioredoxin family protein [Chloroflexia bacterium]